jgi:galactose mutarotase-like enzyme
LAAGKLTTSVTLPLTPFVLTRTISLKNANLRFDYQIENKGPESEPFIWSWHPLLCFEDGDYFELPPQTENLKVEIALNPTGTRGEVWPLERLCQMTHSRAGFLKAFVPAGNGRAALVHGKTQERLELAWDPEQLPWLGIWITRGGWNGYHHAALEPTHGAPDALDVAVDQWRAHATLASRATIHWHMDIHLTG